MTSRQIWEGMLIELSKVNAPSMLLSDFNYFINKAINQYINKRYNIYDINQQTTDDLRVLKSTAILDVSKILEKKPFDSFNNFNIGQSNLFGATYEVNLPSDYLHILNCICIYKVKENWKCYNKGDYVQFPARRLTSDSWSIVVNDYYNRPMPERPYFYIHNVNINQEIPTNPLQEDNKNGTDIANEYDVGISYIEYILKEDGTAYSNGMAMLVPKGSKVYSKSGKVYADPEMTAEISGKTLDDCTIVQQGTNNSNFPRTIILQNPVKRVISTVEKDTATRYGNASKVRMEIRYGYDTSVFELQKVFVDYLKTPQYIRLTQEQVNLTQDTSQIIEFPDYVCQEIINELTMLVMENTADPRLQTNTTVTQSIANPAQQQTQQPQQRG